MKPASPNRRHRGRFRRTCAQETLAVGDTPVLPQAKSDRGMAPRQVRAWMVGGLALILWMLLAPVASPATNAVGGAASPDPWAGLHAWELSVIRHIQQLPDMGTLMRMVTDLGPGKTMWLLIAVLLVAVDLRLAARVFLLVMGCLWLREFLAMVLQSPRPYWIDPAIRTFQDPPIRNPTFGLPSGHAMCATAFWLFLAGEVRRPWAWVGAGVIALAVAFSRVYLGLHFISDVVLGTALGVAWIIAFRACESPLRDRWNRLPTVQRRLIAVGLGLVLAGLPIIVRWLLFTGPAPVEWGAAGESARSVGSSAWTGGAIAGVLLAFAGRVTWTGTQDPWRLRFARLALGLVPAILYLLRPAGWRLSALLAEEPAWLILAARFAVAAVAGWCGWWLAPRFFVATGLSRERTS